MKLSVLISQRNFYISLKNIKETVIITNVKFTCSWERTQTERQVDIAIACIWLNVGKQSLVL